jgi:hypothetical protein
MRAAAAAAAGASRRPRKQMTASRVSTSARAIITSAATHAAEPVMWCAMLKRAMAGPAPWPAATAKGQPGAHAADPHAGGQDACPAQRPAVGAQTQLGGQAAERAHRRADQHARRLR